MPYTAGLLASLPSLDQRRERLASIPGTPPSGIGYGPGCAFAPRCPIAAAECVEQPELISVGAVPARGTTPCNPPRFMSLLVTSQPATRR